MKPTLDDEEEEEEDGYGSGFSDGDTEQTRDEDGEYEDGTYLCDSSCARRGR
jgi:hypothetical protein